MADRKPTLEYRPVQADVKARLQRYGLLALVGGLAVGFGLAFAWVWLLKAAAARHVAWVAHLGKSFPEIVGVILICLPPLAAVVWFNRTRGRILRTQIAEEKAEERRLLTEERTGIGWKVPKSAEAADWPKVLIFTVVMYVITFIAVLAILSVILLMDRLRHVRHQPDKDMGLFQAVFLCANFVGIGIPAMFVVLLLFFPRVRVTLISDGVFERMGSLKKTIPYASIQKVIIAPSRRRRTLKCFAILASDQRFGQRWHRYDFGTDAPVAGIIKAFESRGLSVEVVESTDGVSA